MAEQASYTIDSTVGKVNIGREASVQTADGFSGKTVLHSFLQIPMKQTVQSAGNMPILNGSLKVDHFLFLQMKVEFLHIIK